MVKTDIQWTVRKGGEAGERGEWVVVGEEGRFDNDIKWTGHSGKGTGRDVVE